jgi:hypothetical protein
MSGYTLKLRYEQKRKDSLMSHHTLNTTPLGRVDYEWLGVNASVGKLVNQWSLRQDLVVALSPTTSIGAPACFNPALAEIEVSIEKAFGVGITPDQIGEITQRKVQLKHAMGAGAIYHEALHARLSRWSLEQAAKDLTPRELRFIHAMEESRIEYWGCQFLPKNRALLRACAIEIVLDEIEEQAKNVSKVDAAAFMALLTLARVDAGVLDARDIVDSVHAIVGEVLSDEVIAKLRAIWKDFQQHDQHSNALPLYDLTREFLKVLDERKEETGESEGQEPGEGGTPGQPGEPGTGDGQGRPTPEQVEDFKDFIKKVKQALKDNQEAAGIATQNELDDEIEVEERKEEAEAREQDSKTRNESKDLADKVFNQDPTSTGSHVTGEKTRSRLIETRTPKGEELAAANRIANALRKAKYRERSQTRVASVVPPGRLRSRAFIQGQALKARGVHTPVEAWRTTKRKTTDDPTLNVGVIVDISGSMKSAMTPMAITAWVMSEAVRRVQGKCAMVYCGQDVFPTLKPGQRLTEVKTYTASDSTEEFDKAFKAIDGAMNLTRADGAKLLVVVSDGHYRPDQKAHAKKLLRDADKAGVAILWLTFDGKVHEPAELLNGTAGRVVDLKSTESPTTASAIIGEAAAKALSAIGSRV